MFKRKSTLIFLATIALAATSSTVLAADQAFCAQYAMSAQSDYQENVARKCGYSDNRWSDKTDLHYAWCLQVDEVQARYETEMRAQGLAKCRAETKNESPSVLLIKKFPKKPIAPLPIPPKAPEPGFDVNMQIDLGVFGGKPKPPKIRKKFIKPMYKGARLDFCYENNDDCGQEVADEFCQINGFARALVFKKAIGKGLGYDTIQIGTNEANEEEPASAFKSITCVGMQL